MGAIWDKVADAAARQYEYLGANDVLELADKSDLEINQEKSMDVFGAVFSTLPTVFFAWLVININWLHYLTNQTRHWIWNIGGEQVRANPTLNIQSDGFPNRPGQYILGGLGFGMVLGAGLSVATGLFVAALRMPKQILISAYYGYEHVLGLALPRVLQANSMDNRHLFLKFLGLPGALIGGVMAAPVAMVIGSIRILFNAIFIPYYSVFSGVHAYTAVLSQVEERRDYALNYEFQQLDFLQKYILGFPGLVIGGCLGSLVGMSIVLKKIIDNSYTTFTHLSKTYLNTAFERDIFEHGGIYYLRGRNAHLGFGAPGILLSVPVAFFAASIAVLRYAGPVVMGTLMLAPSIVRRVLDEGFKGFFGTWRLTSKPAMLNGEQHQVFRIIYANKNAMDGRLPENTRFHVPPTGGFDTESGGGFWYNVLNGKNILKFIRKVFTFNAQTLHEEALDRIYRHLNSKAPKASEQADPNIRKRQILEQKLNYLLSEKEKMFQQGSSLSYYSQWRLDGLTGKLAITQQAIEFIDREARICECFQRGNRAEAINMTIDLAVDELKQTYRHKSPFMMSMQQKNDNDHDLNQLSQFIKQELANNADSQSEALASAPSEGAIQKFDDDHQLPPSYAVATRGLYVHRNRFFGGVGAPPSYQQTVADDQARSFQSAISQSG